MPTSRAEATRTERERFVELLVKSGPVEGEPPWKDSALAVFGKIRSAIPVSSRATVSEASCYRNGCMVELTAPNATAFSAVDAAILGGQEIQAFAGQKARTGPEFQPDGSVAWVLLLFDPTHESRNY